MAQPPMRLGALDTCEDDLDGFNRAVGPYVVFTQMFNMSGQPAASLPLHWTADGLPVGVQIAARVGEEAPLLRSEEHTSELPSLMRNSYAGFCLQNKNQK